MSPEDAKIIFGNISELAIFADALGQELESALGALVEGGQGPDSVGSLFLEIAPDLEGPYKQYITRHPSALQHLQSLPQTPALTAYLSHTQTVASSVSHAWDLSSLLIKPVQRLLKYPLLLCAIIDETPDDHPDKENLRNARIKLEEIARNVNEERRRAEVVKDVLMSKKSPKPAAGVGVAAQVNLSKMKSLRHGGVTAATMRAAALAEAAESTSAANAAVTGGNRVAGVTGSTEAALVEQMQNELRSIELFAQLFAKNVVDWSKMMSHVMVALRVWTLDFGKVIGLAQDQGFGSEAFDAFLDVVEKQLMPLAVELEGMINERLLKDMAHLLTTMHKPLKLLASMNDQEPFHYHLLTMPVSAKNRPPPSLLAASTNYLALRGQLAAELPTYLRLLHRGFDGFVLRLAEIQMRFWGHVRERWGVLWEMLRVEGELNAGWEETVDVWRTRWGDVDVVMRSVGILKPGRGVSLDGQFRRKSGDREHGVTPAALYQQQYQQQQQHYSPRSSASSITRSPKVGNAQALIASLEPRRGSSPARPREGSDTHLHAGKISTENASVAGVSLVGTVGSNGTSSVRSVGEGVGGGKRGSSQDSVRNRNRDGKRRSHGQLQQQIQNLQQQLRQLQQPQQLQRDMERHSIDLEDDYVSVGTGGPPPYESRGGGRQGMQRMKSMPLHTQSKSQSHNIHPYPITNQNPRPNLNTKSSLNLDKSSLLTISTSTSTTTTTATFTGTTTTTMTTLGTSRDSGDAEGGGGGGGGLNVTYRTEDVEYAKYFDAYAQYLDKERTREKDLELERGKEKERGRRPPPATATTPPSTPPTKLMKERPQSFSSSPMINNPKRKSKERPTHSRNRSGSVRSITSFFTSSLTGSSSSQPLPSTPPNSSPLPSSNSNPPSSSSDQPPPTPPPQFRDSWCTKPAKYVCQVIHPCTPPSSVSYYSFPFFTLREGELLEVLQEAGHPSIHPKLPLWVDDGEDCLLLCREGAGGKGGEGEGASGGNVGWALASFLEPLSLEDG